MPGSTTSLSEFSIIEILRERCAGSRDDVVLGIGDDAAVTQPAAGCELITATDALVEGTHFLPGADAASLGHRSLAVNLSDLAAMGAKPCWAALSLSLSAPDGDWLNRFADGFARLAAAHEVALIGGDTVKGPLTISVTLLGTVAAGGAVLRSGAAPGDDIYVTGDPGRAAAGRRLEDGELVRAQHAQAYRRCFDYPEPRVAFGAAVAELASAMIDVSDGVAIDLKRLLAASGVGADAAIPDLRELQLDFGAELARDLFLTGGEDYELCFTAPGAAAADIETLAASHELRVSCLGKVSPASGLHWSHNGEPVECGTPGFEHFEA